MDPVIFTPRLKLSLVTKAERGSPEFEWLQELSSDEKATSWSLNGRAKSIEDTERFVKASLPTDEGEQKIYRVAYAVHRVHEPTSGPDGGGGAQPAAQQGERPTEFIGLVTLKSLVPGRYLVLPEALTLPAADAATTLTVEVAYMFLPNGWGKGFATESVAAVLEACRSRPSFWSPYSKLYVRAIVNGGNPASLRVMHKTGMRERGIYEWTGEAIFLGGKWEERSNLHIFGMHMLE